MKEDGKHKEYDEFNIFISLTEFDVFTFWKRAFAHSKVCKYYRQIHLDIVDLDLVLLNPSFPHLSRQQDKKKKLANNQILRYKGLLITRYLLPTAFPRPV